MGKRMVVYGGSGRRTWAPHLEKESQQGLTIKRFFTLLRLVVAFVPFAIRGTMGLVRDIVKGKM